MKLHKYNNKTLGVYHTYDVDDVYEAIYVAKYPISTLKTKEDSLSKNKTIIAKIQQFKVQESKYNFMEMLMRNKVQIVEPNSILVSGFSYIKYQNNKWKPIFYLQQQTGGGDITPSPLQCKSFLNCLEESKTQPNRETCALPCDAGEETCDNTTIATKCQKIVSATQIITDALTKEYCKTDPCKANQTIVDNMFDKEIINEVFPSLDELESKHKIPESFNFKAYHKKQLMDKLEFIENNFDFEDMLQKLDERGILTKKNKFDKYISFFVKNYNKITDKNKIKFNPINIHNSLPSYQFLRAVHSFLNDDYTKSSTANATKTANGGANGGPNGGPKGTGNTEQTFIGSHWLGALFFNKKDKIPKHTLPGYFQELKDEDLADDSDSDDDSVTWEELYYGVTAADGDESDENGGEDDGEEPIDNEVKEFMKTYGFAPSEITGEEQTEEDKEYDAQIDELTESEDKIEDMTSPGIIIRISLLIFAIVFIFSSISNHISSIGIVNLPESQFSSSSNPLDFAYNPYFINQSIIINSRPQSDKNVLGRFFMSNPQQEFTKIQYSVKTDDKPTSCSILQNIKNLASNANEITEKIKSLPPPQCQLSRQPADFLTVPQLLLVHDENVLVYFVDMMHHLFIHAQQSENGNGIFNNIVELQKQDIRKILFQNKDSKIQNYKDLIKDETLPNVLKMFKQFVDKYITEQVDNFVNDDLAINSFFKLFHKHTNTHERSQDFIDRMNHFQNILVEFIKNARNSDFKNHKCEIKIMNPENKIQITFSPSTNMQILDITKLTERKLEANIQQINKEFIPKIEQLLQTYYNVITDQPNTDIKKDVLKFPEGFELIKDFKDIFENINRKIDDVKQKNDRNHNIKGFREILEELKKIPDWKPILEQFQNNAELGIMAQNLNIILGVSVSEARLTTQKLVNNFISYSWDYTQEALPSAVQFGVDEITNMSPHYMYTMYDVSSTIVKNINKNLYTDSDKFAIGYTISHKMSKILYKIFSGKINQFVEGTPVIQGIVKQIGHMVKFLGEDTTGVYLATSKAAMNNIYTEKKNIQERINRGFLSNFEVTQYTLNAFVDIVSRLVKDQQMSDYTLFKDVAQNFSNDFIRLQLEIEKLELALIVMHFHNSFFEDKPNLDDNIKLHDDETFFTKYEEKKFLYIQKILMKNLNIMGLLRMEKYGFQKEWDAISPVQMYWDENESTASNVLTDIESTLLKEEENAAANLKPDNANGNLKPTPGNATNPNAAANANPNAAANAKPAPGNATNPNANANPNAINKNSVYSNQTAQSGAGDPTDVKLVESFISNAQKHNKTVMGNINSIEDINESLKKKLIKSYLKHNNKNIMKKIKRFETKYSRNDKQDFLGF